MLRQSWMGEKDGCQLRGRHRPGETNFDGIGVAVSDHGEKRNPGERPDTRQLP
jgi:hypothetical protein